MEKGTVANAAILEAMDFVVDPKSQKILPNPAHDGKWIIDLY